VAQRITRFSIGQSAKFLGVLYLLFGLLFLPFFLLIGMFSPEAQSGPGAIFGTIFAIGMPIMYAIFGVIGGAIGAALYNLVAGWIGGIEVQLDEA
jgi:hypothetical protein